MKENLEKDKIKCPICNTELDVNNFDWYWCDKCGFEGNDCFSTYCSIEQHKKVYEEFIKENPKYVWNQDPKKLDIYFDQIINCTNDICPICNFKVNYEITNYCPKCGWQDDPIQTYYKDFSIGNNEMSFNDYKLRYEEEIKKNEDYEWSKTDKVNFDLTIEEMELLKKYNLVPKLNKISPSKLIKEYEKQLEELMEKFGQEQNRKDFDLLVEIVKKI